MHLCYLDDSGDSRHGVTITALVIADVHWTEVLDAWLSGRREIHRIFGVTKKSELHANDLYKGRGRFCETAVQERRFGSAQRAASGRMMLAALAKAPFHVMTFATSDTSKPAAYARTIAELERWAEQEDTHLLIFYDGQQGLAAPGSEVTAEERQDLWARAVRDARPYRDAHRSLEITQRRVLEDPVMQDSRFSQLIQAADLLAYGAYQRHRQDHPEIWGHDNAVVSAAIVAYMKVAGHWSAESDQGVFWLG